MNEITQPIAQPRSFLRRCGDGIAASRAEQQRLAALKQQRCEEAAKVHRQEQVEAQRLASLTIVRTYQGRQKAIRRDFARDVARQGRDGYVPVSQSATTGHGKNRHRSLFSASKDQLIVAYRCEDRRVSRSVAEHADVSQQLDKLASLHVSGALSASEFAAAKGRVLDHEF
jgi:hypothetical protein